MPHPCRDRQARLILSALKYLPPIFAALAMLAACGEEKKKGDVSQTMSGVADARGQAAQQTPPRAEPTLMERIIAALTSADAPLSGITAGANRLHIAAGAGPAGAESVDEVVRLISSGADVSRVDGRGNAPLHYAAQRTSHPSPAFSWTNTNDDPAPIIALIKAGADVNVRGEYSNTPLHYAAEYSNIPGISALIEAGADVGAVNTFGDTPLHTAAGLQSNALPAAVAALIKGGADVNIVSRRGRTPLHEAALQGDAAVAAELLRYGADVAALDEDGETPLHSAARNERLSDARIKKDGLGALTLLIGRRRSQRRKL